MKIVPVASPHAIMTPQTTNQTSARDKAMQAFMGGPAQTKDSPLNQNNVAPEDMTAVQEPKAEEQELQAQDESTGTTEDTTATQEQTDTPQEAKKAEVDPEVVKQYAQLARQEKALRAKVQEREQQLKAREDALATKEASIKQLEGQYKQGYISKDQLKSDTLRILADAGISYDELTTQILNQPAANPRYESEISSLKATIDELKGQIAETRTAHETSQKTAYESAIKQLEADTKRLIEKDPSYELIKAEGRTKDVVKLIERVYKDEGVVMSVEEAAQEIENELTERALKLTRLGKIKQRLSEGTAEPKREEKKTPAPAAEAKQPQPMKTLTNAAASARKLTARERAILAFKGEQN